MTSARAPAGMGATELRLSRTGSPIRAPRGWVPPEPGSPRYDSGGSAVAGSHVNTHRLARLTKAVFSASGQGDMRALDLIAAQAPAEVDAHLDWGWRVSHVAAACGMDEVLAWLVLERPELLGVQNDAGCRPSLPMALCRPRRPRRLRLTLRVRPTGSRRCTMRRRMGSSMRSRCCRPLLIRPPPPPLPFPRTKWTRLVHPSVLIGHVSSLTPYQVDPPPAYPPPVSPLSIRWAVLCGVRCAWPSAFPPRSCPYPCAAGAKILIRKAPVGMHMKTNDGRRPIDIARRGMCRRLLEATEQHLMRHRVPPFSLQPLFLTRRVHVCPLS